MSIFVFASRGQHILSFEMNALLGFVAILIQNSNLSPPPPRAPALCLQLQSTNTFRLVWKSDVG